MGKGILLFAIATLVGASTVIFSGRTALFEAKKQQSQYQETQIARNLAESGVNQALGEARRELEVSDHQHFGIEMDGGEYDVAVEASQYGNLRLGVTGKSGEASHTVEVDAIYETPIPAAVVIYSDNLVASSSGSYLISGQDQRAPSVATGAGYLRPAYGIVTTSASTQQSIQLALDDANVVGSEGSGSYDYTPPENTFESIYSDAMAQPEVVHLSGPYVGSYGTVDSPALVHVVGDFEPSGPFSGAGLLAIEDGHFEVGSDFHWEGLVMLRKSSSSSLRISLTEGATIYGGLAAFETSGAGSSDSCDDVPFTIDGVDTVPEVPYFVSFDVLGAAISYGGSYDMPVTTKVLVGDDSSQPWGSWGAAVDGNVNDGGEYTFAPETPYAAGTAYTISARSWKKKSRRSGSQNSHWTVFMEQDSESGGSQLIVLRNGDEVPNVAGYLGQSSIADFVQDYVDDSGHIVLAENQAIYLFELGSSNPSSPAFDSQDLVVLATMTSSDATCTTGPSGPDNFDFHIADASVVRYSGEAIARLGTHLQSVREKTRVVVTEQAASTGSGETYQ